VPFAKEIVTLDDISSGRLVLGIGAGGYGWDANVLGLPPLSATDRFERFSEFVELTDALLRQQTTSYRGRFFAADEATSHPGCVQQPRVPFAVAATGPRGMRLAARFADTWVTTGEGTLTTPAGIDESVRAVADQVRRLEDVCAEVGRDPATLGRLVLTGPLLDAGLTSPEAFRAAAGRYADAGATDVVVHWPRPTEPYRGDVAVFERVFSS
jgi:alkanesulfonate monooxygenase SsuD/methylene tetrahydromethanopterin reductase-like flavin-dependent oxidoreductase (luciferase family)